MTRVEYKIGNKKTTSYSKAMEMRKGDRYRIETQFVTIPDTDVKMRKPLIETMKEKGLW